MHVYVYMCFYVCLHLHNSSKDWRPWIWEELGGGCMKMGKIWGKGGWNVVNTVLMYDILKKIGKNQQWQHRQTKLNRIWFPPIPSEKINSFDLQMYLEFFKKAQSLIIFPLSSFSMIQHWGLPFWKYLYTCHLKHTLWNKPTPRGFQNHQRKRGKMGAELCKGKQTQPVSNWEIRLVFFLIEMWVEKMWQDRETRGRTL